MDSKKNQKETKTEKKPEPDKLQEVTELLQRTQANFENYRKQTEKRIQEIRELANKDLIVQLLPVLDNFELALKNTGCGQEELVKGIELIYAQLFTVLKNQGIEQIEIDNAVFDPNLHEALIKVASEKPENTILEELQKGFKLNQKVIRCAKVKVSAGMKKEIDQTEKTKHKTQDEGGQ